MLERRRQDQRLAEMVGLLVDREAGAHRGELEEHAARLAEVDRAEPEAVDDAARRLPGAADGIEPGVLLVHVRGEGDVVDGAGAGDSGTGGRRRVVGEVAAAHRAAHLPGIGRRSGTKPSVSSSRRRLASGSAANARTLSKPCSATLGRNVGMVGDEGSVGRRDDGELETETLRVVEPEPPLGAAGRDPLRGEPRLPEVERLVGGDAEGDRVHHPGAGAPAARARVLEERDVGAGAALLVGVEEVVDGGVVLVDGLLDHAQAEHPRVEVDVARRVAGDAGHVVDAFEAHCDLLVAVGGAGRRTSSVQGYLREQEK